MNDLVFKNRAPLYEKLLKLRDFKGENRFLNEKAELELKRRQKLAGISDEDLKAYEVFKLKEELKAKEKANEKARVIDGVKFKNKEELRDWMMQHSFKFQVQFFLKGMAQAMKAIFNKHKKQKV